MSSTELSSAHLINHPQCRIFERVADFGAAEKVSEAAGFKAIKEISNFLGRLEE
jgi:hypothetical protein